jgi:8-oxo-dGTP pyrophosphatase MutT (NUDIX family)
VPDIVNAVMLRERSVLLAKRSATRRSYPGLWSFPGGHVEQGEDLDRALHRELGEEIGVVPLRYRALATLPDPHTPNTTYHPFAVTTWQGEPRILDDEHSELAWFDLDDAVRLRGLALESYRTLFAGLGASG